MPAKKRSSTRSKRTTRSSASSKKKSFASFWSNLRESFRSQDNRKKGRAVAGLLLLGLTLFATLSVVSYWFVGHLDQSVVDNATPTQVLLLKVPVQNWGKIYGAFMAQHLMHGFLGFGSLFLILFVGTVAVKLLGAPWRINLFKRFIFYTALAFWTALTAASIGMLSITVVWQNFRWGGLYGQLWAQTLRDTIGIAGLCLVIIFSALVMAIIVRSETLDHMHSLFGIFKKRTAKQHRQNESHSTDTPNENAENVTSPTAEEKMAVSPVSTDWDRPHNASPASRPNPSQNTTAETAAPKAQVVWAAGDAGSQPVDINRNSHSAYNHTYPNSYTFPPIDLLNEGDSAEQEIDMEDIKDKEQQIINTLANFKMEVTSENITVGPTVTLYEVAPDPGIKISRIRSLEDDIAMSIKSMGGIRIIAPIPGKGTIGIEVPNKNPRIVTMHSLMQSRKFQESKMELPVAMGRTITNDVFMFDLTKMPHLLIAGATGQGKSVGLNVLITSLLYSKLPNELKFLLIDPKMLEFSIYEGIAKHYLTSLPGEDKSIITDMTKVVPVLNSLCMEMDNRYVLLTKAKVRSIKEYNALIKEGKLDPAEGHTFLPYIVLIVDEFADLIMTSGKEVERPIARIAQKARAAGIHMIIATQRPSVDVITGIIKANFPARIAFKVFSQVDSKTILDGAGANLLVGKGDMLFYQGKEMIRLQCGFVDTPESEAIIKYIKAQESPVEAHQLPEYTEATEGSTNSSSGAPAERDPMFKEVALMVVNSQQGSTSNIQRRFNIGYNRAGRIMDQLEEAGIVSAQDGSKPRQVLVQDEVTLSRLINL